MTCPRTFQPLLFSLISLSNLLAGLNSFVGIHCINDHRIWRAHAGEGVAWYNSGKVPWDCTCCMLKFIKPLDNAIYSWGQHKRTGLTKY